MRSATISALLLLSAWHSQDAVVAQPSTIVGVVVTDTYPALPVSRAVVSVSGAPLVATRTVVTGEDGRFTLDALPAGRYLVRAEKAAFITSEFGAKRPGRPGVPVGVGDGHAVSDLTIRLARGAAVAGVLRDQSGLPVPSVPVTAIPLKGPLRNGTYPSLTNNGVQTNHSGEYRVFGLEPGSYLVQARPPVSDGGVSVLTEERIDRIFAQLLGRIAPPEGTPGEVPDARRSVAFTPIYYPGTPDPAAAAVITLARGEERLGVDLVIDGVPSVKVEGMVTLASGGPAVGASVFLRRQTTGGTAVMGVPSAVAVDKSGRFRISDVTSGNYTLFARFRDARESQPGSVEAQSETSAGRWASTRLTVTGTDISGLRLDIQPGIMLVGRAVFAKSGGAISGTVPKPAGINTVLRSDDWGITTTAAVKSDGSFTMSGLPSGSYRLQVTGQAHPGWFLQSAIVGDLDALDSPVELVEGAPQQVVLTFTDQETELSGRLQTADERGVSDVVIIAFSSEPAFWRATSRRIRTVRPATDGSFSFRELVPGGYYLAALVDVDPGDWLEPGYLDSLKAAAVMVQVKAGAPNVQDLMVRSRSPS